MCNSYALKLKTSPIVRLEFFESALIHIMSSMSSHFDSFTMRKNIAVCFPIPVTSFLKGLFGDYLLAISSGPSLLIPRSNKSCNFITMISRLI